ncbi:MAG: glucose-6-phosphate dehydrogenase assembly protein OpcA [Puniceicoccales bacterium]
MPGEKDVSTNILEALPGIVMPISEVNRQLGRMWQPGKEGSGAPSEFRASQMNLILHFGKNTSPEDAQARFDEAIHFSQRYPCRIIVLCPEEKEDSDEVFEGKLFAQCYIGHTPRTMCCCEALMVGYPPDDKGYLKNQVSIWLESDLPTCHWFHRVPVEVIREHYRTFSHGMKRVLFDSSVEENSFQDIPWENPERVKDLARARLLPIRQSIGQYLSGFAPEVLIDGVNGLHVSHSPDLSGEARNLSAWMKECLVSAGAPSTLSEEFSATPDGQSCISGKWTDASGNDTFSFTLDLEQRCGKLRAQFGTGEDWPFEAHLLGTREALSEAVFF